MVFQAKFEVELEASPNDTFWGVGLYLHHEDIKDKTKWRGKNMMGKALMAVRQDLFSR